MADVQGLQGEEFGMLLSQLEQMLSEYRKTYPAPAPELPRQWAPMEPGKPTPPGWMPPGQEIQRPQQKPYTAYNALAQPIGAIAAMADNVNPLTYMTGPSVDYLPQGAWTDPVRTGYQHFQDVRGGLLSGISAAGQTMEAVSPALGPADAPLYGLGKVLQAPAAAVRAATRATAASAADLPHTVSAAAQRAGQAGRSAVSAVRNPLATVASDVRAGLDDARVQQLTREADDIAREYESLGAGRRPGVPVPISLEEMERRSKLKTRAMDIGDEVTRLTGDDQFIDARGFGMYDIPDLKMRRPSPLGVPMPPDSELPVYLRRTPVNPLIADQRPGRVQSGASPLPEIEMPLTIQGVPFSRVGESEGYRRPAVRTDALTYEDNPAAQARVRRGQEYLAEPRGRTQQPMPDFDGTNARDRLQWLVQKGKISKESVLSSPDPAKMLEITAEYLGYRGPQRMQALATDLGIVGGPGADLRIGGIVKSGPQGFESRPEWQAYDRTMGDAQSMGRFSANPPSPVRSGPDLVETPHGMRDPVTGRWVSGPRQTPQGDARAQSGGFGDAPDNPLARRPRR